MRTTDFKEDQHLPENILQAKPPREAFLWVVQPIAGHMHSSKAPGHRHAVYRALGGGQRAAFMFWVLVSHAADEAQFYTWVPYMRAPEQGYWNQLRQGMERLGCTEVLHFIAECDALFGELEKKKPQWSDFTPADLEAPALHQRVQGLYSAFEALAPGAMESIGLYIKEHAAEFVP